MKFNTLDLVALVLVIVGGLNWLLVAFGWNLVTMLLGEGSALTNIVYVLVGLSAIYLVVVFPKLGRN
ncbi:MAG: DUF378 domain-containing protein [Candidatus Staskawiczbacteria bacterium]|jgi:hypothetical protein